jgi:hypothetical protein
MERKQPFELGEKRAGPQGKQVSAIRNRGLPFRVIAVAGVFFAVDANAAVGAIVLAQEQE